MITAKGTGFLAAAVILLLLAELTQVGWIRLVDAILWGIVILSTGLPPISLALLDAQLWISPTASSEGRSGPAEGEQVEIRVNLRNRAFWPSFLLSLSYHCPLEAPERGLHRFFVAKLAGSGQVSMLATVEANQRGMHLLGPVMVESSAPFGLFRRRVRLVDSREVLVYPRIHRLRQLMLANGISGSSPQPLKSRVGAELAGSRQYLPGDPLRHIHWRNTARVGRPMVREFEETAQPTITLCFDASQVWGEGKDTTLEYGIQIVASAACWGQRSRFPLRVLGGPLRGQTRTRLDGGGRLNTLAWTKLLTDLALVTPGQGCGMSETLGQVPPKSSVLAVVSAADSQAMQTLGRLAPTWGRLVVVVLEGFGEPELAAGPLDSLRQRRIPLVWCQPGTLKETFQALDGLGGPTTSDSRTSVARRRPAAGTQNKTDKYSGTMPPVAGPV